jgi:hypothetical protein
MADTTTHLMTVAEYEQIPERNRPQAIPLRVARRRIGTGVLSEGETL